MQMSTNNTPRRLNIHRYEPLMDCRDQEELRFLKDNGLLHIEHATQRDDYSEFQNKKLNYLVNYLVKKHKENDVLSVLGLAHFKSKSSSTEKNLGAGIRRRISTALDETSSAPSNMRQILEDYCRHGMNGFQKNFDLPVRDKQQVKKLLKKAKAAWRRKVTRMRTQQLIVDIPPSLVEEIDNYYSTWRCIPDNIAKTRNDMLEEWLRARVDIPFLSSPQAGVNHVSFSGNIENITHQSVHAKNEFSLSDNTSLDAILSDKENPGFY